MRITKDMEFMDMGPSGIIHLEQNTEELGEFREGKGLSRSRREEERMNTVRKSSLTMK